MWLTAQGGEEEREFQEDESRQGEETAGAWSEGVRKKENLYQSRGPQWQKIPDVRRIEMIPWGIGGEC